MGTIAAEALRRQYITKNLRRGRTCSVCGKPMFIGTGSRPQGESICRPCRRSVRTSQDYRHPCADCKSPCWGEVCRPCRSIRQQVRELDDVRVLRRQREQQAPGLGQSDRGRLLALWKNQGRRCSFCPALADTIDHVVPLVRGGTNYEGNLVPACRRCNSSKGPRLIIEWRSGRVARRTSRG